MILLISDDLLDASSTIAHARVAGKTCRKVHTMDEIRNSRTDVELFIVDLGVPGIDVVEVVNLAGGKPVIAYGAHVNVEALKQAREAGCTEVLPRSKYFAMLPERWK